MPDKYRTVGSYILFKEVAEDVLGHLYRAGELGKSALERVVWLRLFDGPGIPKEEVAAAVDQAAEIGTNLKATNIVPNPAVFVQDGTPGLAWDDVPGQPLARVFAKTAEEGFPVPVDNALLIVEKVALALSSGLAVEVGGVPLAHGFLTPEMILVTNDGEALVAGFGLGDALLGSLNDEGIRQAVAGYIAPEVLVSRIPGKRGDVYSLGAILFRLLTGHPLPAVPEERATALSTAALAYDEGPIPQDIMGLLTRALADRPADRFSSAADFKKELDKLLFGGAYSPTTFNLALFMDRLFRPDIEAEQRERSEEQQIDVAEYLRPEPEPVVMPETGVYQPEGAAAGGKKKGAGMWIGIGAAIVIVAAVVGFVFLKPAPTPQLPPPTPTPTAEQIAAQKAAQQKQVAALVAQQVNQMMAEKEKEIRKELAARQAQIAKLQKKLQTVKKSSTSSAEQRRKARQIQQQIAAQQRAAKAKAAALEAERKKAEAEAERKIKEEQAKAKPSPVPTAVPAAQPKVAPTPTPALREGQFVDPTLVDTQPALLRMEPVVWPPQALHSHRRGVIIMSATVNAHGVVTKVKILRADDKILGIPQAAMAAAKKYIFKPATKDGIKVTTTATVTIPYAFTGMVP